MTRASVWRRLLGYFIDLAFIFPAIFIGSIPLNLLLPVSTTSVQLTLFSVFAAVMGGLLLLARDCIPGSRSPGHYLTGTSIKTENGAVPSTGQLIQRNLPLLFLPIELIGVIYYGFKKRFGDTWSDTKVVLHNDSESSAAAIGRWALAVGLMIFGFYVATKAMQFNLTTLRPYEIAVEKIKTDPSVKSAVGSVESVSWFPQGNVNINNKIGVAVFSLKVFGEEGTRWARIRLVNRNDDDWKVTHLQVASK